MHAVSTVRALVCCVIHVSVHSTLVEIGLRKRQIRTLSVFGRLYALASLIGQPKPSSSLIG